MARRQHMGMGMHMAPFKSRTTVAAPVHQVLTFARTSVLEVNRALIMCFSHNEPNTTVRRPGVSAAVRICTAYTREHLPGHLNRRVLPTCRSVPQQSSYRTCHSRESRPHQDEGAAAAAQQPSLSSPAKHTLDDDSENDTSRNKGKRVKGGPLDVPGVMWSCRKCNRVNHFEELYCTKATCKRGRTRELRSLENAPRAITSAERGGYAVTQPNILLCAFFFFESSGVMLPLCSMKRHRHHVRMSETNALATTVKALLVSHA